MAVGVCRMVLGFGSGQSSGARLGLARCTSSDAYRIEEALAEFTRLDKYEDSEEKSELAARTQDALEVLKARQAEYTKLRQELSDRDDTQISLTDPDARSLIKHGRESLVGYNVQSVVDDANKLIVHTEVTNENDLNASRIPTNCLVSKPGPRY